MKVGKSEAPYRCFAKAVFTWDAQAKIYRLVRIVWRTGEGPGFGRGASHKLALALSPRLLAMSRGYARWALTVLGIRVSYVASHGGWLQ